MTPGEWGPRRLNGFLVVLGILILFATAIVPLLDQRVVYGIVATYVVTGGLLEVSRLFQPSADSFSYAVLVAICSVAVALAIRLVSLFAAWPDVDPLELTFLLWQPSVFVPFVIAFLAPLGAARRISHRAIASLILVTPLAIAIGLGATAEPSFGSHFLIWSFCLWYVGGAIAGLPVYLVGLSCRQNPTPSPKPSPVV